MNAFASVRLACITVLGTGYIPIAPATWSSALSILLFMPLWFMAAATGQRLLMESTLFVAIALASALAVQWGPWAIRHFGRRDPRPFTLDEFAGQWLSLILLPIDYGAPLNSLVAVLVSQFLFFRFFDISKMPPGKQLERLPDGTGILADDLCAGVYANLAGQLLWRVTPLAAWLGLELGGVR
ncbi:MAG: phosphatidylglycerophosphatase A [Phycisphaerales bacterium]|nr:phosphatidylglycerophosphatase A [Phycisphaerales bacterium]